MGEYGVSFNPREMQKGFKVIDPRSKPDSGNPTVRDCRGAAGNVVRMHECARLFFYPTIEKD